MLSEGVRGASEEEAEDEAVEAAEEAVDGDRERGRGIRDAVADVDAGEVEDGERGVFFRGRPRGFFTVTVVAAADVDATGWSSSPSASATEGS